VLSGDPTKVYALSDGVYLLSFTVALQSVDDYAHAYIRVNGTRRAGQSNFFAGQTGVDVACTVTQVRTLAVGNYIEGEYDAGSVPTFVIGSTIGGFSSLSLVRLGIEP
jgi:hypothetical protein